MGHWGVLGEAEPPKPPHVGRGMPKPCDVHGEIQLSASQQQGHRGWLPWAKWLWPPPEHNFPFTPLQ